MPLQTCEQSSSRLMIGMQRAAGKPAVKRGVSMKTRGSIDWAWLGRTVFGAECGPEVDHWVRIRMLILVSACGRDEQAGTQKVSGANQGMLAEYNMIDRLLRWFATKHRTVAGREPPHRRHAERGRLAWIALLSKQSLRLGKGVLRFGKRPMRLR